MHTLTKILGVSLLSLLTVSAFANEGMENHEHTEKSFKFGQVGQIKDVTKTILVTETDTMQLEFDRTDIKFGETVKFVVTNKGTMQHEFSLGDTPYQLAHAEMMKKYPTMKHNGISNAVTLAAGETKTIVWRFPKKGVKNIEFACQEAGHYEAGMKKTIPLIK